MPPHKSFSGLNRDSRRPQWQRSRSNPTPQTTVPKPPLPVSKTTKSKLQAFQFEAPRAESKEEPEPVNRAPDAALSLEPSVSKPASPPAPARFSTAVTPAGRPTWQDVLRRSEAPKPVEHHSPSERILWRNDHNATLPVAMSPLLPRKGRKRARSSSPMSSPATKRATPGVDVKGRAQVLRTPRADPALDLWDRFALPGANTSPSGLTNPLLAQLMVSSSPRPPHDGHGSGMGSGRPLRKAISCGSNWPKRRKVERSDSNTGDPSRGQPTPSAKSSMVSALLETVNGEIKKSRPPQPQVQQPRMSSSPQTLSPHRTLGDGPNHARQSPAALESGSSPLAQKSARATVFGDNFSDYDDDFDDETFLELDASLNLVQGDDLTLVASSSREATAEAPAAPKTAEDEFGDLDDDFFDGAEELLAQVEAKQVKGGDDDDAYGDDFGDIDFDAFELAATQAASRPFSSN
ncbi:hypothetical protein BT67DRAFT_171362 [Trichocladium antarcticum]|uniref:Uncharacterized protein n=1 Tax=Trichocladium antarcticum TaxID=1450529 RepID=A0AAN6UDG9_9PEZI|nr:hypothetical protein BT67DRAFT_171362 [Trichocladium antarcticum]